jgi:hypothetical protein
MIIDVIHVAAGEKPQTGPIFATPLQMEVRTLQVQLSWRYRALYRCEFTVPGESQNKY